MILKFLKQIAKFNFSERDRWGNTPFENALEIKSKKIKVKHEQTIDEIIEML
jgi:lysophospholipase